MPARLILIILTVVVLCPCGLMAFHLFSWILKRKFLFLLTFGINIHPLRLVIYQMTPQEFETLILPHADVLYNTALRLTQNVKDAEDLIQEVFFKAYRSKHQFQIGTNAKAWLFKILINTHISKYRKHAKEPKISGYDDVEEFSMYSQVHDRSTQPKDSPEEILDRFLAADIYKAIDKLPETFRSVVLLVDIEGFSYKEAADILDVPVGTVMSRLFRSRKLLQRYLWDYAKEHGYVNTE